MKTPRLIFALLLGYWLVKAALYALVLPPYLDPQELFVTERALYGQRYHPINAGYRTWERIDSAIWADLKEPALRAALTQHTTGSPGACFLSDPAFCSPRGYLLQCPSPYFPLLNTTALLFHQGSPRRIVFAGRLLSIVLGGATLGLIFSAARSFFPGRSPAPVFAVCCAALTPPMTAVMTVATPESLKIFVFSSFFALIINAFTNDTPVVWRGHILLLTVFATACGGMGMISFPLLITAALLRPRGFAAQQRTPPLRKRFRKWLAIGYVMLGIWLTTLSIMPHVARDWIDCALRSDQSIGFDRFLSCGTPITTLPTRSLSALQSLLFPFCSASLSPGMWPILTWTLLLVAAIAGGIGQWRRRNSANREPVECQRLRYLFWIACYGALGAALIQAAFRDFCDGRKLVVLILPLTLMVADGLTSARRPSRLRLGIVWLLLVALVLTDGYLVCGRLIPRLLLS